MDRAVVADEQASYRNTRAELRGFRAAVVHLAAIEAAVVLRELVAGDSGVEVAPQGARLVPVHADVELALCVGVERRY